MAKLKKLKVTNGDNVVLFLGNELTYPTSIGTVLGVAEPTAAEAALPVAKIGALLNSSIASRVVVTARTNEANAKNFTYQLVCSNAKLADALGSGTAGLIGKQIDGKTIRTARQPTRRIFVD